jgi:hypothetical protein
MASLLFQRWVGRETHSLKSILRPDATAIHNEFERPRLRRDLFLRILSYSFDQHDRDKHTSVDSKTFRNCVVGLYGNLSSVVSKCNEHEASLDRETKSYM